MLIEKFKNKKVIYLVEIQENFIKIGSSQDIDQRKNNLKDVFGSCIFLDVFECNYFREIEQYILCKVKDYIYKNPINAIYSRFEIPAHLEHIQCDKNIKINDVLNTKLDLYGIEEFFDNYTKKNNRNYKIYCIKYEEIWNNMKILNKTLNIPDNVNLYPKKIETNRKYNKYVY
jgi:hypothetical protein